MRFREIITALSAVAGLYLLPATASARAAADAPCLQKAETNYEFSICTGSIRDAADARLNIAWKRLFNDEGGSKTQAGRALLTEQRLWIAFREKACKEYFLENSGREEQVIHGPMCLANIIDSRADDLNARFDLNYQDLLDQPRNK